MNISLDQDLRARIWETLFDIPDENFTNGRTAAYWHVISVLENHVAPSPGRFLKLDLDKWDVAGKVFELISYERRPESTGVLIEIKDEDGTTSKLVVPSHSIEWIS